MMLPMFLPVVLAAATAAGQPLTMGAPLGVSWGVTYGLPPHAAARSFSPQASALGASFTRVTLYWSQLEPEPGVYRWTDLDAYLAQLHAPGEGMLTITSASPWATRTPSWVFPSSPAKDAATYGAFVRAVVARARGRIGYHQTDPEPNNPFFWNGSAAEFAAQQRTFYAAVKSVDPQATVLLGGCDGLFDPTGAHPLPNQEQDVAFFSQVVASAAGAYDAFDLRLYGDPYGIASRVALVRSWMAAAGGIKPIVSTEYDGPRFFDIPQNRRWYAALAAPGGSPASLLATLETTPNLPPLTRMYLPNATDADAAQLVSLEIDDLVIRNVLALASGVQKTAFFELWRAHDEGSAPSDLDGGTFTLLQSTRMGSDEVPGAPSSLGAAFGRLAMLLRSAREVQRVDVPEDGDAFVFRVERAGELPLWIAWRRAPSPGAQVVPEQIAAPWLPPRATAFTLTGTAFPISVRNGAGRLTIDSTPLLIHEV